jgi:DNA-binding CsgD family transcriptional regulator
MVSGTNSLECIDLFIRQVDESTSLDEIKSALETQVRRLGFDKFCYWLIWPPSGPRVQFNITNYPARWLDHYISNNYKSDDLTGRYSALCSRPFSWKEVKKKYLQTPSQRRVFDEARDATLTSGASVPIHGPGAAVAAFSVSNDMEQAEFEKLFLQNRHEIHIIATYAHERIMAISFSNHTIADMRLTAREVEVVTWIARGKTKWETAEILNISEDTVKQHVENASAKLGASNKTHLVANALQSGLITL